jgi:hypothetical protein
MSKFRGDTFKFPDEVQVKAKVGEDEQKVEFEIEGAEVKTDEDKKVAPKADKPKVEEDEIEIIDDTPADDGKHTPHEADPDAEELDQYSSNVKKRIDKLTLARREEERAKQAALREKAELERLAEAVTQENRRLQEYMQNGEKAYMEKVEALAKVELERAKQKMSQAYDAGDSAALANAQEEMMLAGLKVQQAQNFRPTPIQQVKPVVQSAQTAPANAEPDLDPKTSAWMSKNEWFGSDSKKAMTSYAFGLHQELVDKYGQDFARTDEYFTQIDAQMRRVFPGEFGISQEPEELTRETPKTKPATVVAPASRVTAAKKIRLTQTQVSIAKRLGVPLETYAKHVAAMEKQNG